MTSALETVLFDFARPEAAAAWHPISDRVMGGISTAVLEPTSDGTAVFQGRVSRENDGGFASIRSRPHEYDLRAGRGLALRVRGDGRRYKINLKTDARFDGLLYRTTFEPPRDTWKEIALPFAEFLPTLRGRIVPDAAPLDLARIRSIGLMITDHVGPFRLELAWIRLDPRDRALVERSGG